AILTYFYVILGAVTATSAALYLSRPTHLSITDRGLQFIWYRKFHPSLIMNMRGDVIPWEKISRVLIEKPAGKPSPSDHCLSFVGDAGYKAMKLRLGAFWTMEDRSHVLEAIERFAPGLPPDTEVIACLEPPADYSYTELWMKALSAPPKRERLK